MAIHLGTDPERPGQVAIARWDDEYEVITFDTPADILIYAGRHPKLKDEIMKGEWVWQA